MRKFKGKKPTNLDQTTNVSPLTLLKLERGGAADKADSLEFWTEAFK
jgi:hypothetical protein